MRFFMKQPTKAALNSGFTFLRILSPFYFLVSSKLVADDVLRGAGKMKDFMTATFTDLVLHLAHRLGGTMSVRFYQAGV